MILEALQALMTPVSLFAVVIGTVSGILVGGMPGLTATMAVALLIPVTFALEPLTGLILMGGVYCGAMYGGSIPAILLRTPGTPAAVATAIGGYPMSQNGHGGLALKVSVIASFCGGTFSTIILLLVAPILATFALTFGPPEYFLLAKRFEKIYCSRLHHRYRCRDSAGGRGHHRRLFIIQLCQATLKEPKAFRQR